jgi:hypothetical protein
MALRLRREQPRRAAVIGAGSFGTAAALLLDRARVRTTLVCRTREQATRLRRERVNERYLEGIDLPESLDVVALPDADDHVERAELVLVAVPSAGVSAAVEELAAGLQADDARTHLLVARNARRIAHVDHSRPGLFLFNHFLARDPDVALALWDRLAAWYEANTGLDNSMLLAPAEGEASSYSLVNHARWDAGLACVLLHQMTKPSFFTFVRANLRANDVTAVPALYRLAG